MHVVDVLCVSGRSDVITDDQAAIRAGAVHDGFAYAGAPVTPGFDAIRMAAEAV
jgi:methylaspartate ammonia-lyase